MPREGLRIMCFSPKFSSNSFSPRSLPSPSRFGFSPSRPSFSESVMGRTLDLAEPIIMKWSPETSSTALFHENRREARDFIRTVNNLQKAMQLMIDEKSNSDKIVRAQNLMQIAMKRLQKEFYQILSTNRAYLDPESVSTRSSSASTGSSVSDYDDDEEDVNDSISEVEDVSAVAMADLRSIAECMIASGYAKECLKIYNIIRKSIVDEGIYKLGVEKFTSSQIHKMDWETLDLRIRDWLNAVVTAVKTLFNGERILCDHVFASSDSIRESCFAEITREGATILFGFPETVAKHTKKSSEKVFRILDMYTGISNHWNEIDSIFSLTSTENIKSQALTSLVKLGEFVLAALDDFESTIQKDSSKSPVAGAGIHSLTVDSMNYLMLLSDYGNIVSDILADSPPPAKNSLPESYCGISDSDESPAPAISIKMAWLVLVLLCKLDTKAKHYKDVSQSYLFLANNLQYVVVKVQTSNLKYLLGEEWLINHESKVKQFAANYERLLWGHVVDCLSSDAVTSENVKEVFKKFNTSFDEAYRKQAGCVVPDNRLRDYMKNSIEKKIVQQYREFYGARRMNLVADRYAASVVRYTPDDVRRRLSDLFHTSHLDSGLFESFSPEFDR